MFETWQLRVCESHEGASVSAEVWDRHLDYAVGEQELRSLSPSEAANISSDPKYRKALVTLRFIQAPIQVVGSFDDRCYDRLGHQKVLILKAGSEPHWQEIKFATYRLLNSEIVLEQLEINPKTGKLSEIGGSGEFECWREPPTE